MKVFKIVLYLFAATAILLLGAYTYYGGFQKMTPTIVQAGGETLVYEKVKGDYKQSPAVSDRVYNRLRKEFEIETERGFGIYYDNPQKVPMPALRSDIGCILENKDTNRIQDIQTEFYVSKTPEGSYLEVKFPFKGSGSILVGIMKVYPTMHNYMKDNGYDVSSPVMEIWDLQNKVLTYRQAVVQNNTVLL